MVKPLKIALASLVLAGSTILGGYSQGQMQQAHRPRTPVTSVAQITGNSQRVELTRLAQATAPVPDTAVVDEQGNRYDSEGRLIDGTLPDPGKDKVSTHRKTKSLEECIDCPPELRLQPGTTKHIGADGGTLASYKDALTPQSQFAKSAAELCDRFADEREICLYPGQSAKAEQVLTKRQNAAIKRGEATFKYVVSDRMLRAQGYDRDEIKRIKGAFLDSQTYGEITDAEFESLAPILKRSAEGKPRLALPYFSVFDIKNPNVEDCEYGRVMVLEQCSVPTQVIEVPPPVPEPVAPTPYCGDGMVNQSWERCDDGNKINGDGCTADCQIEVPPVVYTPPIIQDKPTTPFQVRLTTGPAGLTQRLDWDKLPNENCPTPLCTASFAEQEFEGKHYGVEVGYIKEDVKVTLGAEKTDLPIKTLSVSHSAFRPFFDIDKIEQREISLEARGSLDLNSPVEPYIGLRGAIGDYKVSDANTSATFDTKAYQGTIGLKAGGFNKSHGFIGAGYKAFDLPNVMVAPQYATTGTVNVKGPIAEAGGQLTLFNRADLFGVGTYHFNNTAGGAAVDNRIEWKAGTNIWIDNRGAFQWGVTGDYKHRDPVTLDVQGPPPGVQNLVPKDQWGAGVILRFGQ